MHIIPGAWRTAEGVRLRFGSIDLLCICTTANNSAETQKLKWRERLESVDGEVT